jgi:hypothetical protein
MTFFDYRKPVHLNQPPSEPSVTDADLLDALRRADRRGRVDLARRIHARLDRRGLHLMTIDLAGSAGGRS